MSEILNIKARAPDEDRRALGRFDGRIWEGVSVRVNFDDALGSSEFKVIDFSSIGLGVESLREGFDPGRVKDGATARVRFHAPRQAPEDLDLLCTIKSPLRTASGRVRFGLEITQLEDEAELARLVANKTIELDASLGLVGLMDDPFQYDQTCLIRVERVSAEYLVLHNADPIFAVFPTMHVIFSLNLFAGNDPIHGQVLWVRRDTGEGGVSFAVKVDYMSRATNQGIVRFIMRFRSWPPKLFTKIGMDTSHIKNIVTFRFVKTQQEYEKVLELRRDAYAAAGKLKRDIDLGDVSFQHDQFSRLLTAWHQNELVGSVGIRFADDENSKFEIQKHVGETLFLRHFPDPKRLIEVYGLCMHRDYRKSDILTGIFERIIQVMITTEREYIIAASDKYLWPTYDSLGFVKTGLSYLLSRKKDVSLDVIVLYRRVPTYGWGDIDPERWDAVFRGISEYLDDAGVMPKSYRQLLFSPVYRMYVDIKLRFQDSIDDLEHFQPDRILGEVREDLRDREQKLIADLGQAQGRLGRDLKNLVRQAVVEPGMKSAAGILDALLSILVKARE